MTRTLTLMLSACLLAGCADMKSKPVTETDAAVVVAVAEPVAPEMLPPYGEAPPPVGFTAPVNPDTTAERAGLARVERELAYTESLAAAAQRNANAARSVVFDYNALRRDLELVRSGVRLYLLSPDRTTRRIEPLRGDYLR